MQPKLEELVMEAFELQGKLAALRSREITIKAQIQQQFDELKIRKVELNTDNGKILAFRQDRLSVEYHIDKIKENFGKEANEFIEKTYTINDLKGLIELLKEAGISPKDFKQFINTSESIDRKKLDNMYQLGEISKKQLEGCYEAKLTKTITIRGGKD